MSDLKICRICLRTDAKVYKYDQYTLGSFYEELLVLDAKEQDMLPKYFCFECAILLHKFHKFKEKCCIGRNILEEMCHKGQITYELVNCIDRTNLNLLDKSPLERIILAYNNDEISPIDDNVIIKEEVRHDDKIAKIEVMLDNSTDDTTFDDRDSEINITKVEKIIQKQEPINKKKHKPQVKKDVKFKKRTQTKERNCKSKEESKVRIGSRRLILMDDNKWKKYDLSEDDALQEFQSKAYDNKYTSAAFKCTDCFKGFSEEDMLKRHIKIRHSESKGAIECQFCRMRFKRKCRLRQHIREHYTKYKCVRCNFICVLETTALSHEHYHNGVTRKCKYCDKEFRYASTYYTHLRTHRSQYVCTFCGSSFVSEAGLHQHKRVKHCTNDTTNQEDDEEVNKYCSRCNIHFETSKAYEEHLYHSTMHAEIEENGTENDIAKPLKVFEKTTPEKVPGLFKKRKIDDISFKSGKRCKKPTTCHQCGKHFNSQSACLKHHLEEHPGTSFCPPNQRHICEICGASLAPGSVAVHKNMHTREKIFACETCGRQFYESVGLKRHMLTHTGEKPFACTSCDKRFTQSASLKLHYRTFHLKQPYPKRNRRKKGVTHTS
ncbi:zinc finger protein 846-like isoform X2 [Vanessa cardui]|uniref:zinc finger protein 846-like isoform X2 n=1 Tax=Vanessa cardui TaxID=171605 RepID=UPI001F134A6F|nr:zinc finger protein 846-like isoform X2 [Vanessa cardui]